MDLLSRGHRVHFSEDSDELGHTLVVVKEKDPQCFEAHVGFLQICHRYHLHFCLPVGNSRDGYKIKEVYPPNLHCKILCLKEVNDGKDIDVFVEFFAHKEKLMKEKVFIVGPNGDDFEITILARVLGHGKGTPMLREGITCVGVEMDEESEMSDWQGFN